MEEMVSLRAIMYPIDRKMVLLPLLDSEFWILTLKQSFEEFF